MKLLFIGSGRTVPSCRFRIMQLVPFLRRAGHTCVVANSFPAKYDYIPWMGFRPSQKLKRLVRYWHLLRAWWGRFDAIILEREVFHDSSVDMEQKFRRLSKVLVLDIDDAVFLNFPGKAEQIAEIADLVIVGNQALQEWAKSYNNNVAIVPTSIDTTYYDASLKATRPRNLVPVIGWMGTSGNIPYLRCAAEGLKRAAQKHSFILRVISNRRDELDEIDLANVNVEFEKWSEEKEVQQVAAFDIGLMPLEDEVWTRYKCGMKLLQYMALGIPGIASSVGVNSQIVKTGINGFLASSADDWFNAIDRLLSSEKLRDEFGKLGRAWIEEEYSLQVNHSKFLLAIEHAVRQEEGVKN